jgi:hypothetical protein
MGSSPPFVTGTPDQQEFFRWVRERIQANDLFQGATELRLGGAESSVATAGNVATQAVATADEATNRTEYPAPTGRLPADLRDVAYWEAVIGGVKSVFGANKVTNARNVLATTSGIELFPSSAEGAWLDITGIYSLPVSRRVFVNSTDPDAAFTVQWRDTSYEIIDETRFTGGIAIAPALASAYNVALSREVDEGTAVVDNATIFEVIGENGLYISPDGVLVTDGSGNPVLEISPNTPVLEAPTDPTLASENGTVVVRWDGLLTDGAPGPTFWRVIAQQSSDGTTGWVNVGQPLQDEGDISVQGAVGDTLWYRLIAVDNLNRVSDPSGTASITVSGVDLGALAPDVYDAIINAQETADGKNKIFAQETEPVEDPEFPFNQGDQWWIVDLADPDGFSGVKIWNGTDWVNYFFVADSIVVPGSVGTVVIADGAITSDKITAGTIEADRVSPAFGSSLNLEANGSINFLVGETQNLATTVGDQQGQIDGLGSDVAEVGAIASDASSVANDAATAASSAQATADATAATVEPLAQTYRFTTTGAFIGAPGSPYEFNIENTGANILYNGVAVSTWTADEMWVKQFRGDIVKLGDHQIERYSGGGTVVRAI